MANEVTVQQGAMLPKGNASTMVAQTREMAEAISMVQMAKAFPRDVVAARDRILNACARPKLAEVACYTYARGGQDVTGPSIRLAEALAQNWGNITFGIRELEQRNGESTCEAFAWDLETNARQTKVFQVPHIRYTRAGAKPLADPRDIYELVANQGARRLRACILGIIPGDVVEEAVKQCDLTLKTKCDITPDRLKNMVEAFAAYGVSREQIEARIQRRLDAMTPAQFVGLMKIYNSLKDGMSKPADWFDAAPAAQDAEAGAEAAAKETPAERLRRTLGVGRAARRKAAAEAADPAAETEAAAEAAEAADASDADIPFVEE